MNAKFKLSVCVLAASLGLVACDQKKKKPKADSPNPYQYSTTAGGSYPGGSAGGGGGSYGPEGWGTSGGIDIRETGSGTVGDVLLVHQGRPVVWQFQAFNVNGGSTPATIVSITASPQPPSMQINGNSVTFTPTNQSDLQGTLTILASSTSGVSPGLSSGIGTSPSYGSSTYSNNGQTTKIFRWQSGSGLGGSYGYGNGAGNALPQILLGVLPQLLNGNGDLGSIFGAVLGGIAGQNTGTTGTTGTTIPGGYGTLGNTGNAGGGW